MGKKDRHSAQCAWLFGHAHLTGKACIEFKDRIQLSFSSLGLALDTFNAEDFFEPFVLFLTTVAFDAVFDFAVRVVFFTVRFGFTEDQLCCSTRSARTNSSWLGLSTS